jgi:DNA replication protein DnaC
VDLVILDELGYLPFSQAGGALLFHLLSKLYEHTSVAIYHLGPRWLEM